MHFFDHNCIRTVIKAISKNVIKLHNKILIIFKKKIEFRKTICTQEVLTFFKYSPVMIQLFGFSFATLILKMK
jgi:hypothetical protein